ncbi:hypothetical protein Esti_005295 [Eimeria stiedai]
MGLSGSDILAARVETSPDTEGPMWLKQASKGNAAEAASEPERELVRQLVAWGEGEKQQQAAHAAFAAATKALPNVKRSKAVVTSAVLFTRLPLSQVTIGTRTAATAENAAAGATAAAAVRAAAAAAGPSAAAAAAAAAVSTKAAATESQRQGAIGASRKDGEAPDSSRKSSSLSLSLSSSRSSSVVLIDVSLKNRAVEDELLSSSPVFRFVLRRGLSLLEITETPQQQQQQHQQPQYILVRRGLPKFYDLELGLLAAFVLQHQLGARQQQQERKQPQNQQQQQTPNVQENGNASTVALPWECLEAVKRASLTSLLSSHQLAQALVECSSSSSSRSNSNRSGRGSFEVWALEKVNGDGAQISFCRELNAWACCSKNVCLFLHAAAAASSSTQPSAAAARGSQCLKVQEGQELSDERSKNGEEQQSQGKEKRQHVEQQQQQQQQQQQHCERHKKVATLLRLLGVDQVVNGSLFDVPALPPRETYALRVAAAWEQQLQQLQPEQVASLQQLLQGHTLVGELLNDADKQHIIAAKAQQQQPGDHQQQQARLLFFALVSHEKTAALRAAPPEYLGGFVEPLCLNPGVSLPLLKSLGLQTVAVKEVLRASSLLLLLQQLDELQQRLAQLQTFDSEGLVLYICGLPDNKSSSSSSSSSNSSSNSSSSNSNSSSSESLSKYGFASAEERAGRGYPERIPVVALCKVKASPYRVRRRMRQIVRAAFQTSAEGLLRGAAAAAGTLETGAAVCDAFAAAAAVAARREEFGTTGSESSSKPAAKAAAAAAELRVRVSSEVGVYWAELPEKQISRFEGSFPDRLACRLPEAVVRALVSSIEEEQEQQQQQQMQQSIATPPQVLRNLAEAEGRRLRILFSYLCSLAAALLLAVQGPSFASKMPEQQQQQEQQQNQQQEQQQQQQQHLQDVSPQSAKGGNLETETRPSFLHHSAEEVHLLLPQMLSPLRQFFVSFIDNRFLDALEESDAFAARVKGPHPLGFPLGGPLPRPLLQQLQQQRQQQRQEHSGSSSSRSWQYGEMITIHMTRLQFSDAAALQLQMQQQPKNKLHEQAQKQQQGRVKSPSDQQQQQRQQRQNQKGRSQQKAQQVGASYMSQLPRNTVVLVAPPLLLSAAQYEALQQMLRSRGCILLLLHNACAIGCCCCCCFSHSEKCSGKKSQGEASRPAGIILWGYDAAGFEAAQHRLASVAQHKDLQQQQQQLQLGRQQQQWEGLAEVGADGELSRLRPFCGPPQKPRARRVDSSRFLLVSEGLAAPLLSAPDREAAEALLFLTRRCRAQEATKKRGKISNTTPRLEASLPCMRLAATLADGTGGDSGGAVWRGAVVQFMAAVCALLPGEQRLALTPLYKSPATQVQVQNRPSQPLASVVALLPVGLPGSGKTTVLLEALRPALRFELSSNNSYHLGGVSDLRIWQGRPRCDPWNFSSAAAGAAGGAAIAATAPSLFDIVCFLSSDESTGLALRSMGYLGPPGALNEVCRQEVSAVGGSAAARVMCLDPGEFHARGPQLKEAPPSPDSRAFDAALRNGKEILKQALHSFFDDLQATLIYTMQQQQEEQQRRPLRVVVVVDRNHPPNAVRPRFCEMQQLLHGLEAAVKGSCGASIHSAAAAVLLPPDSAADGSSLLRPSPSVGGAFPPSSEEPARAAFPYEQGKREGRASPGALWPYPWSHDVVLRCMHRILHRQSHATLAGLGPGATAAAAEAAREEEAKALHVCLSFLTCFRGHRELDRLLLMQPAVDFVLLSYSVLPPPQQQQQQRGGDVQQQQQQQDQQLQQQEQQNQQRLLLAALSKIKPFCYLPMMTGELQALASSLRHCPPDGGQEGKGPQGSPVFETSWSVATTTADLLRQLEYLFLCLEGEVPPQQQLMPQQQQQLWVQQQQQQLLVQQQQQQSLVQEQQRQLLAQQQQQQLPSQQQQMELRLPQQHHHHSIDLGARLQQPCGDVSPVASDRGGRFGGPPVDTSEPRREQLNLRLPLYYSVFVGSERAVLSSLTQQITALALHTGKPHGGPLEEPLQGTSEKSPSLAEICAVLQPVDKPHVTTFFLGKGNLAVSRQEVEAVSQWLDASLKHCPVFVCRPEEGVVTERGAPLLAADTGREGMQAGGPLPSHLVRLYQLIASKRQRGLFFRFKATHVLLADCGLACAALRPLGPTLPLADFASREGLTKEAASWNQEVEGLDVQQVDELGIVKSCPFDETGSFGEEGPPLCMAAHHYAHTTLCLGLGSTAVMSNCVIEAADKAIHQAVCEGKLRADTPRPFCTGAPVNGKGPPEAPPALVQPKSYEGLYCHPVAGGADHQELIVFTGVPLMGRLACLWVWCVPSEEQEELAGELEEN